MLLFASNVNWFYLKFLISWVIHWVAFACGSTANGGGLTRIRVFSSQRTAADNGDKTLKGIHEEHGWLESRLFWMSSVVLLLGGSNIIGFLC